MVGLEEVGHFGDTWEGGWVGSLSSFRTPKWMLQTEDFVSSSKMAQTTFSRTCCF